MTLTLRQPRMVRSCQATHRASGRAIKVLLVVDECDPFGTPGARLGYELSRALARQERLEVTIVTHSQNRDSLEERPIDAGLGRSVRLEFVDGPRVQRRLGTVTQGSDGSWNKNEPNDTAGANIAWEKAVQRRFKKDLSEAGYDVIHCLGPNASLIQTSFPSLTEIPTLVGPVAVGQVKQGWEQDNPHPLSRLRQWLPAIGRDREPGPAGIIAGTREALAGLAEDGPRRFYLPDAELEPERFPMIRSWRAPSAESNGGTFRFVTAGPLESGMSIDWVIRAMGASPTLRNCHLTVIGEGPELANLKALAGALGLRSSLEFVGKPSHQEIQECLRNAQAFVFPSDSESDGGMIVEAMAAGLPVIVRDSGEAREIVDHSHGIRLPHDHPEGLMKSVRQTMERLATDFPLCQKLGKAGSRRARETFSWALKAAMIVRFYESVIESNVASDLF